jgi:hypothetical protein
MRGLGQNKRPIRRISGAVLLAAVLLLGVIGASAIAIGNIKVINWKGEDVTEERLSEIDTSTETSPGQQLAWQLYGKTPANEYWAINYDKNTWTNNTPKETVTSFEDFESRITSDSRFPIPRAIPEGYRFESAELTFHLTEKTIADGFVFLKKGVMDEGVTVYKYRVPDSVRENIAGYSIRFQKDDENFLNIRCDLGQLSGEQFFYLNEEEGSGEPVAVKGMLDGLYMQDEKWHRLHLRTMYLPNEEVRSRMSSLLPVPLNSS